MEMPASGKESGVEESPENTPGKGELNTEGRGSEDRFRRIGKKLVVAIRRKRRRRKSREQ